MERERRPKLALLSFPLGSHDGIKLFEVHEICLTGSAFADQHFLNVIIDQLSSANGAIPFSNVLHAFFFLPTVSAPMKNQ